MKIDAPVLILAALIAIGYIGLTLQTGAPPKPSPEQIAAEKDYVRLNIKAIHQKTKAFPSQPPMLDHTVYYHEMFAYADTPPYYYKYYLYVPAGYDPAKSYPLVLLLHGVSRHMHGGIYLLDKDIQARHPSFVVVPIAPEGTRWDFVDPRDERSNALPLAMDAVQEVLGKYSIDRKRIYVSGYSMGGSGTFSMVERYPNVFAGAMALCGTWQPERAKLFPANVPVIAAHGSADHPENSKRIIEALRGMGKPAFFREYPGVGHDVWNYVYPDPEMWELLFKQKRK